MAKHSRAAFVRLVALCGSAVLLLVLILGPLAGSSTGQVESSPAARLADLGMKFDGAGTCGGSNCHGKRGDDSPPTELGHEHTIWAEYDPHKRAFETLSSDDSKAMGEKLTIADVQTSAACLSCHALNVAEQLRGEQFSIKEGVTCASCHGPSEKWLKPHAEDGWMAQQREKFPTHEALLKEWGIYDTKPLSVRAPMCSGCHLAIDAELIAAGHPQPHFELDWYQREQRQHWIEPEEPYHGTRLWLAGQIVGVRDAMTQLAMRARDKTDAELVQSAYQQAMAHLTVLMPAADAAKLDAQALQGQAKKLSDAMTNAAENADAIASIATEVSAQAGGVLANVDSVRPDRQTTVRVLAAVAGNDDLAGQFGSFGMNLQSWTIHALYDAYSKAESVPDADKDAIMEMIIEKLIYVEEPDNYPAALIEVRAKLPK